MNYPTAPVHLPGRTVICPQCNRANQLGAVEAGRVPVCAAENCGAFLPWIADADDTTLMDELKTPIASVIVFWGDNCAPCAQMKPIVEDMAAHWPGRVKVIFVHVQRAPGMTSAYQVAGIPTIVIGRHGQIVDRINGLLPLDQMRGRLAPYV